jgi:hypothetical protein
MVAREKAKRAPTKVQAVSGKDWSAARKWGLDQKHDF